MVACNEKFGPSHDRQPWYSSTQTDHKCAMQPIPNAIVDSKETNLAIFCKFLSQRCENHIISQEKEINICGKRS